MQRSVRPSTWHHFKPDCKDKGETWHNWKKRNKDLPYKFNSFLSTKVKEYCLLVDILDLVKWALQPQTHGTFLLFCHYKVVNQTNKPLPKISLTPFKYITKFVFQSHTKAEIEHRAPTDLAMWIWLSENTVPLGQTLCLSLKTNTLQD